MVGLLDGLPEATRWRLFVDAAKHAAEGAGYKLTRVPGRGLSNIWNMEKGGKSQIAAIRTTRDRWIAFPPLNSGTKWKTLDDVKLVVVAAVDSKDNPQKIIVYIFPADDVRKRFDAAYAARAEAGHTNKDNFGMWVALDHDPRGIVSSVGSGIVQNYKPVAVYPIESLLSANANKPTTVVDDVEEKIEEQEKEFTTISEVMAWARNRVAEIAGVKFESVKLDLKLEY